MGPVFKINSSTYFKLIVIHVIIGLVLAFFRSLGTFYFMGSVLYFIYAAFRNHNKRNEALVAASYMMAGEVIFRMTSTVIPWETGKYSVISFLLIGLFLSGTSRKTLPYWIYLLLLVPGIVYAGMTLDLDTNLRKAVIFNLSGPICLGIAALYCYDRRVSKMQLQQILWAIIMPGITMTAYLFIYTPDTRDVLNSTASNFALSGGFGPNQVSTILGLSAFAVFVQCFINTKNKLVLLVNLFLLLSITYRAVLTFSRGGVLTALIISILFLVIYYQGVPGVKRNKIVLYSLLVTSGIFLVWFIISIRTMGLIDMRYANKDAAGRIKENITTGRTELISSELNFFYENPLMGIGVGKSRELREDRFGILAASHNEFSRLLSEHGIFGLAALVLLLLAPLIFRYSNRKNYLFYAWFGFWLLTINHSSMRIAAPSLTYALALINLIHERKYTLYR